MVNNKLQKAIKKKLIYEDADNKKIVTEYNLNNEESEYLELISLELKKNYYSKRFIDHYIDNLNKTLLKYAKNDYGSHLKFVGNEYLDSLITCIDFLGEELNYSTVTTLYLEDVFNSIGDMLFVIDNKGYILFINNISCKILKYKEKEIRRQNINIILEQGMDFSMLNENNAKGKNFNFCSKSNEIIPVSLNISDFSRKDNPFMGHVIIARDMSMTLKYQKKIEKVNEDLKIALKKAEESDKLKTAFLQNMSHEIRTPLNGIVGFSRLLTGKNITDESRMEIVSLLEKSSSRLIEIVNNILDIAKIETGQIDVKNSVFVLNELTKEILDFFALFANKKNLSINCFNSLDDDDSMIFSDRDKIHQILFNLINNAIKFTEKGGIDFGYIIKNNQIEFFVRDTGIGIPYQLHDIIFERFMQVDASMTSNYDGVGLGLSICKGLVDILGGKIWVKSIQEKETTFYFIVPFNPNNIRMKFENSINYDLESLETPISILIAEDDEINKNFIKFLFTNTKHKVLIVKNGREVIDSFTDRSFFDIVIMDLKMPVISGFEATKIIKKRFPDVPVIALTAYAYDEDKNKALEAGCDDYITKPFQKEILFMKIIKLIKKNDTFPQFQFE